MVVGAEGGAPTTNLLPFPPPNPPPRHDDIVGFVFLLLLLLCLLLFVVRYCSKTTTQQTAVNVVVGPLRTYCAFVVLVLPFLTSLELMLGDRVLRIKQQTLASNRRGR